MLITPEIFRNGLAKLQIACDFTLPQQLQADWYQYLSAELNDDEFEAAIALACRKFTRRPSPQSLVDLALGTVQQRAMLEWADETYSPVGEKALQRLGGAAARRFGDRPEYQLRSDFLDFYAYYADRMPPGSTKIPKATQAALPGATVDRHAAQRILAAFQDKRKTAGTPSFDVV